MKNKSDEDTRSKHQLIYSAHQVCNKFGNDVFADVVEFALYVSTIFLTFMIYSIVRFHKDGYTLVPILLLMTGITTFSLVSALFLAASCHVNSRACCEAHKKFGRSLRKVDKMFWKSRKPTSVSVGKHFKLQSKTYVLVVFGNVVLTNVIDLLVMF